MSQEDFNITTADANDFVVYRAAINAALQALASNNSGIAPPTTTYAYMFWVDTSTATPTLKQRNAANTGWVSLFQLSSSQWLFVKDVVINGVTVGLGGGGLDTNVALGKNALNTNTTATGNTALGKDALKSSNALNNTAVGSAAMFSNTSGTSNSAVGSAALYSNLTGLGNSVFGNSAFVFLTSGNDNVAIGSTAGISYTSGSLTSASQCVFIGSGVKSLYNGDTNEIVIGYNATGAGSNTATLGNDAITKTILKGTLKLGTVPAVHADNAAALAAGHVAGEVYRTATGVLMVTF